MVNVAIYVIHTDPMGNVKETNLKHSGTLPNHWGKGVWTIELIEPPYICFYCYGSIGDPVFFCWERPPSQRGRLNRLQPRPSGPLLKMSWATRRIVGQQGEILAILANFGVGVSSWKAGSDSGWPYATHGFLVIVFIYQHRNPKNHRVMYPNVYLFIVIFMYQHISPKNHPVMYR